MVSLRLLFCLGIALALCPGQAAAQSAASTSSSPFLPSGSAAGVAPSAPGQYELVGMIAGSKHTLVGITDTASHKSFWVQVGKMAEGIEVVSCDPKTDTAVIKINGQPQTLTMQAARSTGSASTPVAMNPASVPAGTQAQQAQQEQDARMLVSDLLEISMQQRKAYEESQKAAAQKAKSTTPPTAPGAAH